MKFLTIDRELFSFSEKLTLKLSCPICNSNRIEFEGIEEYKSIEGLEDINFIFLCLECDNTFKLSNQIIKNLKEE